MKTKNLKLSSFLGFSFAFIVSIIVSNWAWASSFQKANLPNQESGDSPSFCLKPPPRQCDFYFQCIEAAIPCGPEGYVQSFGDRYCRKFLNIEASLSPASQAFLTETRACMLNALVPYALIAPKPEGESKICTQLTNDAFRSHSYCYTFHKNSICFLNPFTDLPIIISQFEAKDFAKLKTIKQISEIATICVAQVSHRLIFGNPNSLSLMLMGETPQLSSDELYLDNERLKFWNSILTNNSF